MPSGAAVADLAGAEDVSGSRKGWEEMRAGWMEGGMDGVGVPWKTMVCIAFVGRLNGRDAERARARCSLLLVWTHTIIGGCGLKV